MANFKDSTVYRDMHFYLESGYKWGEGMPREQSEAFTKEIVSLFEAKGWAVKKPTISGGCPEVTKGWSELYLHPMDASGAVAEDLLDEVAEILDSGTTFAATGERDCGRLYNWTDEEYLAYLEERREDIERKILRALTTKRSNLYANGSVWGGALKRVYDTEHVQRVCSHIGRCSDDVDIKYIEQVRDDLVEQGKLVTAQTRIGLAYRTQKGAIA